MKRLFIGVIRLYQNTLSPDHGWFKLARPTCRFDPSCSDYAIQAIQKYGTIAGTTLGLRRLGRCHPWNPGGRDLVPEVDASRKQAGDRFWAGADK